MPRFPRTWATLVASTFAHGALAGVALGHGTVTGMARTAAVVPVELELKDAPVPVEIQDAELPVEASRGSISARATAPHRHAYPVHGDHDATPHDPKLVHTPASATVRQTKIDAPETEIGRAHV